MRGPRRPGKAQPPPGKITAQPEISCSHCAWQGYNFYVNSGQIALPVNFLRYVSYGAGSAQGAASRRRPLCPRAPASKIAAARSLRLIPAGFGSGRGSVRAKHGPQPASMRAAPAFRERLSDFEAVNTGSFSGASGLINGWLHGPSRPGKAQPPPGIKRLRTRCHRPVALRLPGLRGVSR